MMTVTENTAKTMSQPIEYNNYAINPTYSATTTYDYHHPNYSTFHHHPSPLFPINKSYHPSPLLPPPPPPSSFDPNPNFYRRHTESTLPISNTIYSPSTPFNYSPHPTGLFFGWNNNSSLLRTHSASFQNYPGSTSYPSSYNPSQLHEKVTNNPYPSFLNVIPPTNISLPIPQSTASSSIPVTSNSTKRPKTTRRPRLTAHIRSEILKLKSLKPTIFIWEIQENLLQNGICTSQTLPRAAAIQRVLNERVPIKQEEKVVPSVTICLSPSPSPTLSNGEAMSECSICLETYRSGQEVSILACSHEYHSSCIGEWMLKNRSCPMCRKDIHNQPQFVTLLI